MQHGLEKKAATVLWQLMCVMPGRNDQCGRTEKITPSINVLCLAFKSYPQLPLGNDKMEPRYTIVSRPA